MGFLQLILKCNSEILSQIRLFGKKSAKKIYY